jgi:hypothetical protein
MKNMAKLAEVAITTKYFTNYSKKIAMFVTDFCKHLILNK